MKKHVVVYAIAAAAIIGLSSNASAQAASDPKQGWDFLLTSGTVVPTGAQRDAVKRGSVSAAQLSYAINPVLSVMTTVGWTRSRDIASTGDPKLDVFTYDIGAEVHGRRMGAGKMLSFSPFAGLGAGGRSYNYRKLDVDATHNLAGYASAGGEVGIGSRVSVRIEARDYVTGFKPLAGEGSADARNDVAVLAGLRIKVR